MTEPLHQSRSDGKALIARLESIFDLDRQTFLDKLGYREGPDAQRLLDSFQELLDSHELRLPFRHTLIEAMRRISASSYLLPASYELKDVSYDQKRPIYDFRLARIYKGEFQGEVICIKETQRYDIRILREAILMRNLSHLNVQTVYGMIHSNGMNLMVLQWMENGNFYDYLKCNPNAPILLLANDVAKGLLYLHENDITLRGLISDNIFIDGTGRACLSNFDFALFSNEERMMHFPENIPYKRIDLDIYQYSSMFNKIFKNSPLFSLSGTEDVHLSWISLVRHLIVSPMARWRLRKRILSFMDSCHSTDSPSFAQVVEFFESIITNDTRPPPKIDRFFTQDFYYKTSGPIKLIDVEELEHILEIPKTPISVTFKPMPFESMPFESMPSKSVASESVTFEPTPISTPSNPLTNQNIKLPSSFSSVISYAQGQLTYEHLADPDHSKDLPDMLSTKAQTSATIMPLMMNNSNPWKSFTSCITPDDAQSHAESITPLVHETLANAKYMGAFSLYSGFDVNTIGLPKPEQEIYIVLDEEISDDLSILLAQLANPFIGIVLTPNNWLSNSKAGIEARDNKESETELATMSHSAPAMSGLQEEENQVTLERSENIESCGQENTDENESNESIDKGSGRNGKNIAGKKGGGGRKGGGGGGERGGRRGRGGGGGGDDNGSDGDGGDPADRHGDGGGDDDPDDGNSDDNNYIQNQKIFEIQNLSTIQNSVGQESFSVICNVHAAINSHGTPQWTGPLLKVDIAKLHPTSISTNFALKSCKIIIVASPATAAPSWSPELVPSYEIGDTQEEHSKTVNASVTLSATPSSNIGGQLGSKKTNSRIEHPWKINSYPFSPTSSCSGIQWIYQINPNAGPLISFKQTPSISFVFASDGSVINHWPTLTVQVTVLWEQEKRNLFRIFLPKSKSILLPANLNFFHHVSMKVNLQDLDKDKLQQFAPKLENTIPEGWNAKTTSFEQQEFSPLYAPLSSECKVTFKHAAAGIVRKEFSVKKDLELDGPNEAAHFPTPSPSPRNENSKLNIVA